MKLLTTLSAAALAAAALGGAAQAAGGEVHIKDHAFDFEGPFGVYDQAQLQRGYQVFQEVCSACHGMRYVAFRSLGAETGPGFPEEQVKAIAGYYEINLGDGEYRQAVPTDHFPTPEYFGDGVPPDLSLMAKARAGFHGPEGTGISQLFRGIGGPEYIYSLMTGYEEPPECAAEADMGSYYYNAAFAPGAYPESCIDEEGHRMAPGSWIAMPQQLYPDLVEYADGTSASTEQMAEDIAAFLMWAAEPKLVERKEAGLRNILWLGLLAVLMYYVNKRVWAPVKGEDH
jgi:ubiquinol-cytochrome c reductase cytochrome c1 subunit